jgi:hypothetical protein
MSDKDTKETGKEETKAEGPQGFSEMCRQMMSGKLPECCGAKTQETASGQTPGCCGPEMQGMMARMMSAFQPEQAK